ncbi:MAG: OmpA family protein [Alphaproteobacteria bacterium]
MNFLKLAGVVGVCIAVSACGYTRLDRLKESKPEGTEFNKGLVKEYLELSIYEEEVEYDWGSSANYAKKGLMAARNEAVLPETMKEYGELNSEETAMLEKERARLLSVLDGGARTAKPAVAAHAQAMFDCWVEELDEGHQAKRIEYCSSEYKKAMEELERKPAPQQPAMTMPAPADYLVFFAFDSAVVSDAGKKILNDVVTDYKKRGASATIAVNGHTDTAGSNAYNLGLSKRRAEAVRAELAKLGVPNNKMVVTFFGEDMLRVKTPDNTPEAGNRRVNITVK